MNKEIFLSDKVEIWYICRNNLTQIEAVHLQYLDSSADQLLLMHWQKSQDLLIVSALILLAVQH